MEYIYELPSALLWLLQNSLSWGGDLLLGFNGAFVYGVAKWCITHEPTRIPMGLLICLTPWLAFNALLRPRCIKIKGDWLHDAKKITSVILFFFQLRVFLSQYSVSSQAARELLTTLEAACLSILLSTEHLYAPRPSTSLSIYLASTTILHIAMKWSSFAELVPYEGSLYTTYALITRSFLCILHEQSKWDLLTADIKAAYGQEDASGVWSRALSLPMYKVLWKGLSNNLLSGDTGYSSPQLLIQHSIPYFNRAWNNYRMSSHGLLKACFSVCKKQILRAAFAELVYASLLTGSSLYFSKVIAVAEEKITQTGTTLSSTAFDLIAGGMLLFGVMEFARHYALRETTRAKTAARGVLMATVLQKVPLLSDELALKSSSLSLLIETITNAVNNLDIFHIQAVEIFKQILTVRLLWRDLGYPALVLLGIMLISNAVCFKYTERPADDAKLADLRTRRIAATDTLLRNLPSARMTGKLEISGEQIKVLHRLEMDALLTVKLNWARQITIIVLIHCNVLLFVLYSNSVPAVSGSYASLMKCLYLLLTNELIAIRIVLQARRINPALAAFSRIAEFLSLPTDKPTLPLTNSRHADETSRNAVEFHDANIAVEIGGAVVLHKINLNASCHRVTLIVGEPGSGKSILLKSILGRTKLISGSILVRNQIIAYCAQVGWLHSRSIKDNIIGTSAFDQQWYDRVKVKCLVADDIRRLPKADDFIVNHEQTILGNALRQRLAIARAVYTRAHLTLLDDILSAQDEQMATDLVKSLFGRKGILRKRSVIIVTSEPIQLLDIPSSIFKLTRQGLALETTKVRAMQDYERSIGVPHPTDNARQQDAELLNVDAMARQLLQKVQQIRPAPQSYIKARLWSSLPIAGWKMMFVPLVLTLVGTVGENFGVVYLGIWLPQASHSSHPVAAYVISAIHSPYCAFATYSILSLFCKYLSTEIHETFIDTILNMPVYAWTGDKIDVIQSLLHDSLEMVTNILHRSVYVHLYFPLTMLVVVGFALYFSLWLLVAVFFTIIAIMPLKAFALRGKRQLTQLDYKATQALRLHYVETLAGAAYIYAQGWHINYISWSQPHVDRSQKTFYLGLSIQRWKESVLSLHAIFLAVFLTVICIFTDISPAACTFICFNYPNYVRMLGMFVPQYIDMDESLIALQQLRTFIETAPQEASEENTISPPSDWPSKGIVKFQNASIWFDPSTPVPLLADISYTLKRQAKTGLFGRPGSGKSTLLYALLNMVKYTGSITIDGIEVRTVSQEVLRQKIAILPERPALIIGTIAQNLLPIELHDEEDPKLANVLENILSSLGLLALVRERGGLDAEIADFKFSPDQLQRFALAQTLTSHYYYRQKLMIEDGLCNSVDATTLKYLRRVIKDIFGQGSMIVTGQNLSVVKGSNKIGLVEDGQVWFEP